jgi:two-component system sensor histidine kinase MprB
VSFRTRVALLVAAVVAVVVAGVAGSFLYLARGKALETLDAKLSSRAGAVAQLGDKLAGRGRVDPRLFGLFGRYAPDDVLVQVFDANGRIWASNVEPLPIDRTDRSIAREGLKSSTARNGRLVTLDIDGHRMRVLTMPLKMNEKAVMIARPMDEVDAQLSSLWRISFQLFILGVVSSGAIGFVVAGRVVRPIRRLTEAASKIAVTQDVNQPIPAERADEFGQLATSFNEMLNALSLSREQQHRLVADASHELRTPLTSLRTNLEYLQRTGLIENSERQQALDDVLFELDELTELVTELVELATDRHQMDEPTEMELDEIVDAIVQRHRRRSPCPIEYRANPSRVRAVPALVERAVSNLIDNAVKWSPSGQTIEVEVKSGSVVVRDFGPGIPKHDWERVFERFYRTEDARSHPGSGLGLSIVRHVAESFGGSARVIAQSGPGTAVELSFPPLDG